MSYDPTKTYVTATDWCVSYETSSAFEGVKLNVHRFDPDAPNRFGGRGVSHRHEAHDGRRFATDLDAHRYALEAGLIAEYVPAVAR